MNLNFDSWIYAPRVFDLWVDQGPKRWWKKKKNHHDLCIAVRVLKLATHEYKVGHLRISKCLEIKIPSYDIGGIRANLRMKSAPYCKLEVVGSNHVRKKIKDKKKKKGHWCEKKKKPSQQ